MINFLPERKLRITIDKNLTWNQQLCNVSSHIAKGVEILHKVKNVFSKRTLLVLYNTLILPYINHCNIAWGIVVQQNLMINSFEAEGSTDLVRNLLSLNSIQISSFTI